MELRPSDIPFAAFYLTVWLIVGYVAIRLYEWIRR